MEKRGVLHFGGTRLTARKSHYTCISAPVISLLVIICPIAIA